MQILNFTEPLVKPALQDKSKCFTIRKAWDWLDEGQHKKACWKEQQECRHKAGALEKIMWNQRGKNGVYSNCVEWDNVSEKCLAGGSMCIGTLEGDGCFNKVFGVGKIVQTQKIWMVYANNMVKIKADGYHLDSEELGLVSKQDGFKKHDDFCNFFLRHYPIIERKWMPFWRIGWEWQKYGK